MSAQEKHPLALAFECIKLGAAREIELILKKHPELINQHTFFVGGTLLHYAAAQSTSEVVELLIDIGFDPNLKGKTYGNSALDSACSNGRVDNVRALLRRGAKIDRPHSYADPLFGAIIGKSPEIVGILIEAGADPTLRHTLESGSVVDAYDFALMRGELDCAAFIAKLPGRRVQ